MTREPIGRALVYSTDNQFATMTDGRGRFEFTFSATEAESKPPAEAVTTNVFSAVPPQTGRPYALMARKPGYLRPTRQLLIPAAGSGPAEITIALVPEAHIVGHVAVSGSEIGERVNLELYRRTTRDGQDHWDSAGQCRTRADGTFRFADLPAGTYRLFSLEHVDRNQLSDRMTGQLFGYPPVYYPNASDFAGAADIKLGAGETIQANLALVSKPYYQVKIGVQNPPATPILSVQVWQQGRPEPGYALNYEQPEGAIEGSLPDGTYTVQAFSEPPGVSGSAVITVRGAPLAGALLTLAPGSSVAVNVREEFEHTQVPAQSSGPEEQVNQINRMATIGAVPRARYVQASLSPEDPFGYARQFFLRPPTGPDDDSMVIENVSPGTYRVEITSGLGYVASVRSGGNDLLRKLLVVSPGESVPAIEVTLRDDFAEIGGTVENSTAAAGRSAEMPPVVYFFPEERRSTSPYATRIEPDGSFGISIPPGAYAVVAFDLPHPEVSQLTAELREKYGSMIRTVRVEAGQKERVKLSMVRLPESQ